MARKVTVGGMGQFIVGLGPGFNLYKTPFNETDLLR